MTSATLRGAAACLAAALACTTAEAQLFRAYLASDGSDANPCTLQAPCRLLPAALNAVASGGEIWMLDSANYNDTSTVRIAKSVSIQAVPGSLGSLVAKYGPAILIETPEVSVALRNLAILPYVFRWEGTIDEVRSGVEMTGAGSALTIEKCLFANFGLEAVSVRDGTLVVTDSTFRDLAWTAITLRGGASAAISRVQMLNTCRGVQASHVSFGVPLPPGRTTASISESFISGRPGNYCRGVSTWTSHEWVARISVTRTTIVDTHYALWTKTTDSVGLGSAEIVVGSSLIADNAYAWYQEGTGSIILSLGNNQMSGNGGSVGVLTPLTPQ